MIKASGLFPAMHKLVPVLHKLKVGMLSRWVLWKTDHATVVHCLQHPEKIVFSRTALSQKKWLHLDHSCYGYTMQLELLQPPEELEEDTEVRIK